MLHVTTRGPLILLAVSLAAVAAGQAAGQPPRRFTPEERPTFGCTSVQSQRVNINTKARWRPGCS